MNSNQTISTSNKINEIKSFENEYNNLNEETIMYLENISNQNKLTTDKIKNNINDIELKIQELQSQKAEFERKLRYGSTDPHIRDIILLKFLNDLKDVAIVPCRILNFYGKDVFSNVDGDCNINPTIKEQILKYGPHVNFGFTKVTVTMYAKIKKINNPITIRYGSYSKNVIGKFKNIKDITFHNLSFAERLNDNENIQSYIGGGFYPENMEKIETLPLYYFDMGRHNYVTKHKVIGTNTFNLLYAEIKNNQAKLN